MPAASWRPSRLKASRPTGPPAARTRCRDPCLTLQSATVPSAPPVADHGAVRREDAIHRACPVTGIDLDAVAASDQTTAAPSRLPAASREPSGLKRNAAISAARRHSPTLVPDSTSHTRIDPSDAPLATRRSPSAARTETPEPCDQSRTSRGIPATTCAMRVRWTTRAARPPRGRAPAPATRARSLRRRRPPWPCRWPPARRRVAAAALHARAPRAPTAAAPSGRPPSARRALP